MQPKIKSQADYLLTEVTLEMPFDVAEADDLMKAMRANGKMVVQYNGGNCPGINIEQKTRISEKIAAEIRAKVGVAEKTL